VVALDEEVIRADAGAQAAATAKGAARGRVPGAVAMPEVVLSDLELLGAANAARRERRWREADALYSKVVEAFPSGSVAAVAAIASGELRLDLLGDADGARERFRFATSRGEAHAVDAYEGLFKACVTLRDAACEREARAALEARHAAPKEKTTTP
jgi:tetratricopeptide (TPR) repeat protein